MHRAFSSLIFVWAACLIVPPAASAAPITAPTGLNPGDHYRLAFVTTTERDAASSNIADYNSFVTAAANSVSQLVALGTTWSAIGSTPTVNADDNTGTNPSVNATGVPIYTLGNTLIAATNTALWSGTLSHPIEYDQTGALRDTATWTGTNPLTGTGAGTNVTLGNTVPGGGGFFYAAGGQSFQVTQSWAYSGSGTQNVADSFYGVSGVLTVVPEPTSGLLLLLGGSVAGLVARRQHIRGPGEIASSY